MKYFCFLLLEWLFFQSILSCREIKTGSTAENGTENGSIHFEGSSPALADLDSLSLCNYLYKDLDLFDFKDIDSVALKVEYNKSNKILKYNIDVLVPELSLQYKMIFKDTAGVYPNDYFYPADAYKYLGSEIIVKKEVFDLDAFRSINDSSIVEPFDMVYGREFGIVGRIFESNNIKYILLRGLNIYCNGSHCNNYKIIIIRIGKNKTLVRYANTFDVFPYNFEMLKLFEKGGHVGFYLVKNTTSEIYSMDDFIFYSLDMK